MVQSVKAPKFEFISERKEEERYRTQPPPSVHNLYTRLVAKGGCH